MNVDPQFVDASSYDLGLMESSQCIDQGTDFLIAGGITLIDMDPSEYQGAAPDMGAFEYIDVAAEIFVDGFESL